MNATQNDRGELGDSIYQFVLAALVLDIDCLEHVFGSARFDVCSSQVAEWFKAKAVRDNGTFVGWYPLSDLCRKCGLVVNSHITDKSLFAEQKAKLMELCVDRVTKAKLILLGEYLDENRPKNWNQMEVFSTIKCGFTLQVVLFFVEASVFKSHFFVEAEEIKQRLVTLMNEEMTEMTGILCKKDNFPRDKVAHHEVIMFVEQSFTHLKHTLAFSKTLHAKHAYNNFVVNVKEKVSSLDKVLRAYDAPRGPGDTTIGLPSYPCEPGDLIQSVYFRRPGSRSCAARLLVLVRSLIC